MYVRDAIKQAARFNDRCSCVRDRQTGMRVQCRAIVCWSMSDAELARSELTEVEAKALPPEGEPLPYDKHAWIYIIVEGLSHLMPHESKTAWQDTILAKAGMKRSSWMINMLVVEDGRLWDMTRTDRQEAHLSCSSSGSFEWLEAHQG